MLNKALLASRDELNEFTHALSIRCQRNTDVLVVVRNGELFNIRFCDVGQNGNDCPIFYTSDWHYCWNADGSSTKNRDLDIIECQ